MIKAAEGTIRLLICDDQAIVCEGLRAILEGVQQIEVVGVANNGVDAIELTRTTQPDLVLMDLKMPRMNGIQATKAICEQTSMQLRRTLPHENRLSCRARRRASRSM